MGEETEGISRIDARNGFNELSRLSMIWTVRHYWSAGAIFALNCYQHEEILVVHRPEALCHIMTSREGFTQVEPLSMILYGLAFLTLAQAMQVADMGVL